jgi:hypothetical protein
MFRRAMGGPTSHFRSEMFWSQGYYDSVMGETLPELIPSFTLVISSGKSWSRKVGR